jgi:MFS family permease
MGRTLKSGRTTGGEAHAGAAEKPDAPDSTEKRLPKSYWRLWFASAIDNIGNGAFTAAMPLLAVQLTHSPVLVSAISAAAFLPWILLSLPVGAMVDRYDRKRLMISSQLVQALVMVVTAVTIAVDGMSVGLLVVLAFALGACDVIFGNAAQALVPEVVPTALLHRANGYQNTVVYTGQQFIGPPVGSSLFAIMAAAPFGLNAVSFLGSAALISTLPRPARPSRDGAHPPMFKAIKEGLSWLLRHRQLRTLALLLAANTFCFAMGNSTLVLLATRTLGITEGGYGLLLAAAAIGGAIGGLVNDRLLDWLGALPALVMSLSTTVVVFLAIGFAPNLPVLAALLALSGFATTIWNVLALSLRQQEVPNELRGRVNSVYRMIGWGLIPVGALTGGLVADVLGMRAPYPVAGAIRGVALLVALPLLLSTMRSAVRQKRTTESQS